MSTKDLLAATPGTDQPAVHRPNRRPILLTADAGQSGQFPSEPGEALLCADPGNPAAQPIVIAFIFTAISSVLFGNYISN